MATMKNYYHPREAFRALYYGNRWRLKRLLKLKDRAAQPVIEAGASTAAERHARICRIFLRYLPAEIQVSGAVVAEIGCGDCVALADMFLALGAKHVHLVESAPLVLTEQHVKALAPLVEAADLPNRGECFIATPELALDTSKISFHQGFLEQTGLAANVDLLCSHDVLEHVEDLESFFSVCSKTLVDGGTMVHKFDLSGHEYFEDPIPPLDFQTYPDWLYSLMCPKYRRATRQFIDTYLEVMKQNSFEIMNVASIRSADMRYVDDIYPYLRKKARSVPKERIAMLDVVVVSRRRVRSKLA